MNQQGSGPAYTTIGKDIPSITVSRTIKPTHIIDIKELPHIILLYFDSKRNTKGRIK